MEESEEKEKKDSEESLNETREWAAEEHKKNAEEFKGLIEQEDKENELQVYRDEEAEAKKFQITLFKWMALIILMVIAAMAVCYAVGYQVGFEKEASACLERIRDLNISNVFAWR